jgi:hypothetical protein
MGEPAADLLCWRAGQALVRRHTRIFAGATAMAARAARRRLGRTTPMLDQLATRRITWIDDAPAAPEPAGSLPVLAMDTRRRPRVVSAAAGPRRTGHRPDAPPAVEPEAPGNRPRELVAPAPASHRAEGPLVAHATRLASVLVPRPVDASPRTDHAEPARIVRSTHGEVASAPSLMPVAEPPARTARGAPLRGGSAGDSAGVMRWMRTRPGAAPLPIRPTPMVATPQDARRRHPSASAEAAPCRPEPPRVATARPPLAPSSIPRAAAPFADVAGRRGGEPDRAVTEPVALGHPARTPGARENPAVDRRAVDATPTALTASDVSAMIDRALADLLHDLEIDSERLGRSSWR